MRANVKPFVHWVIYKGYTVRYHSRSPRQVTGILTGSEGAVEFEYDPATLRVTLPSGSVQINEHGWEIESDATQSEPSSEPHNESHRESRGDSNPSTT